MGVTFQPYTPATSLGDELAIIFAFSAAMVGTMIIYVFFWRSMLPCLSIQVRDSALAVHLSMPQYLNHFAPELYLLTSKLLDTFPINADTNQN